MDIYRKLKGGHTDFRDLATSGVRELQLYDGNVGSCQNAKAEDGKQGKAKR